jgi:hypothetical protein
MAARNLYRLATDCNRFILWRPLECQNAESRHKNARQFTRGDWRA